ncbi:hypothetical protein BV25DRAFT_1921447 [Artomyces pyxidatus]|uniref:Uncharacterized protein n=1 Tax=Artomyces pyxidatus TaxID=48021 RepID=A0ACB8SIZ2_9AGAM|nr:hypothetical protein BV25DRAFT_1921447 [Artomyces pyxidatus]
MSASTSPSSHASGSSPSNKRKRTGDDLSNDNAEASNSSSKVKIVQSRTLWLPDGNIIVRASSRATHPTRTFHMYKVHKFILAMHCAAFAALFEGPQMPFEDASEKHDGVPVMDLPDSPHDVGNFLKALYFPQTQLHAHISNPFVEGVFFVFHDSYSGILRLAVKYDASRIRDLVKDVLVMEWPSRIEDWDALQDTLSKEEAERETVAPLYPNPGRAIRLGTDCNVPEVLPCAFYDLTRIFDHFYPNCENGPETRRMDTSALRPDELRQLLRGRAAMRGWLLQNLEDVEAPSTNECDSHSYTIESWIQARRAEDTFSSDPLKWLRDTIGECDDLPLDTLCGNCSEFLKGHLYYLRWTLWVMLPAFFKLKNIVAAGWGEEE